MIFVNFKSYKRASGRRAVSLAKDCLSVSRTIKVPVIPIVSVADVYRIKKELKSEVWVQHIDPKKSDRNTGWVTALSVKLAGAKGVLLNHSEHPLNFKEIVFCIKKAKRNKLKTLICVQGLKMARKVDSLRPDFIALETPKLIAGKKAMVEFPKEQIKIKRFVKLLKYSWPIVGAGVRDSEDIIKTTQLGAKGVLIASRIVKTRQPIKVITQLAKSFT